MRKIISISLSIILLSGSFGLTFGTHFCGGHAVLTEIMLGKEHLDCGMASMDMPTRNNDDSYYSSHTCCENEYISLETDDQFKKEITQDITIIFVGESLANVLYSIDYDEKSQITSFNDSSPPFYTQDLHILHQTFII